MDENKIKKSALSSGLSDDEAQMIVDFAVRQNLYNLKNNAGDQTKRKRARANGEGSIRKRGNTWEARYTAGFDYKTGKQIRRSVYAPTRAEVVKKLSTELELIDRNGSITSTQDYTVTDYMCLWHTIYVVPKRAYSTQTNYWGIIKNHIEPTIGSVKMKKLSPPHVQKLADRISETQSPDLADRVISVLRMACETAINRGLIAANPTARVQIVKPSRTTKRRALTIDEQNRYIAAANNHPQRDLMLTYLFTGMRRSEAIALRWEDVDLFNRIIYIRGAASVERNDDKIEYGINQTKTESGDRSIPIFTPLYDILIARQQSANSELVFPNSYGNLMDRKMPDDWFNEIRQAAKLDGIVLHCLRHTFATRCMEAGVPPRIVQAWLGHKKSSITMEIYTHVNPEIYGENAKLLEQYYKKITPES